MHSSKVPKTFIIYSRSDEAYKQQLLLHLRPLINSQLIKIWHDGDILPGEVWEKKIKTELQSSDLVLFLVSVNSLDSQFIQTEELNKALDRQRQGLTRVIPIIVSPCAWRYDPVINVLQVLPVFQNYGPKPVNDRVWKTEAEAWTSVVEALGEVVRRLIEQNHQRNETVPTQRIFHQNVENENQIDEALKVSSETKAWNTAKKLNIQQVYEKFILNFPDSVKIPEAAKRIRRIVVMQIFALCFAGLTFGILALIIAYPNYFKIEKKWKLNNLDYELVNVKGGAILIGSPTSEEGRNDNECQHLVKIQDFKLGKFEVTQGLWKSVMGAMPEGYMPDEFKGDSFPVENIWYEDVEIFLKKFNQLTGATYRLPTEDEWEYAARGGVQSKGFKFSGSDILNEVAWFDQNSEHVVHKIGQKKPNELGFYDMSGNVWELCKSSFYPCSKNDKEIIDTNWRGGCANEDYTFCRSANRVTFWRNKSYPYTGIRLAHD